MKRHIWLAALLIILIVAGGLVWSGAYNIAADDPHWALTAQLLETARDRSIAVRSSGTDVPDLADESMIRAGAGNYDAMCGACHREPGEERSGLSLGLNPAPPDFTRQRIEDPMASFWVIKHGIKMTGMPAWGKHMDDEAIWGIVAFLRQLPDLSEGRYHALVESSGGHPHGYDEHESHGDKPRERAVADEGKAAVATVDRFFAALSAGDIDRAGAELDPQVVILESGGAEHSATEYLGGHAKDDSEFLRAAQHKLLNRSAKVSGALAWIASESELHVPKDGKPVTILSTETMVLRSTDTGWKIVHIHWSSRTRK